MMFAKPLEEGDEDGAFLLDGGSCETDLLTSGTYGANVEGFSLSNVFRGEKGLLKLPLTECWQSYTFLSAFKAR